VRRARSDPCKDRPRIEEGRAVVQLEHRNLDVTARAVAKAVELIGAGAVILGNLAICT